MSDKQANYRGVFGSSAGFGARPAVLSVDFIRAYTTEGDPFFAPGVVAAARRAGPFQAACRALGLPIIHTNILYDDIRPDAHVFLAKVPALRRLVTGEPLADFDPAVAPAPGDTVLTKQHASAFYGTDLDARLKARGIDTVIVTGCTTSGCVRATVLDAMQHGYIPVVPEELVGDRHPDPHAANLFDMAAKYAEVMPAEAVMAALTARVGQGV